MGVGHVHGKPPCRPGKGGNNEWQEDESKDRKKARRENENKKSARVGEGAMWAGLRDLELNSRPRSFNAGSLEEERM